MSKLNEQIKSVAERKKLPFPRKFLSLNINIIGF